MTLLAPTTSFTSIVCASAKLDARDRTQMFSLLARHFDGVTSQQFDRDLADKNWALRIFDGANLIGFSTMLVYESTVTGNPISVVCSGDTIVDPSAWSSVALPREWIAAVRRLRRDYPNGPYYWLLITSGFRSYRLLSTFWKTFYPCHDAPTPPAEQSILNALCTERFGDRFNPRTGVVRFEHPQVLRRHLAGIPPTREADPHVAFFARHNPGHAAGDELPCLCEISEDNLTRAGRRVFFAKDRQQT